MGKKKKYKKVQKEEKSKVWILPLLILIAGFAIGVYFYSNSTKASMCVKEYFSLLNDKKYDEMYELVETDLSKEDFVNRVKNIYEGIEAEDISIRIGANSSVVQNNNAEVNESSENEKIENVNNNNNSSMTTNTDPGITTVSFSNSMKTLAGNINFMNKCNIKEEDGKYKIIWNSSLIYPDLTDDEKVKVQTIKGTRGSILDRNDVPIAKDGEVYDVGFVPGKIQNKEEAISKVSGLLGISKDTISNILNASYVTDGTFVSLKKISKEEQDLKLELLKIKGIMITDASARVYPYKEATSILTGYVQNGEGKAGLEQAFNDTLKAEDGAEIYISKDDRKVKQIAKKDVKNGKDVKLTIDANIQKNVYDEFKDEEGASVQLNYKTGEILALVSYPSYDANEISVGISDEKWKSLQENEKKPMFNRYLATYAPGSSIKPVVGAIGLDTNSFTASENFGKSGKKWQKDKSWKDIYVTTLEEYDGDANLENALIYSDNIYFAKAALKIGRTKLEEYFNNFEFNTKLDFVQDVSNSTYGKMDSDLAIANTGYGQAEMLVNPILMSSIYSSFANNGTMVKPYILYETDESQKTKIYKEHVIAEKTAETIKEDLKQVVLKGTGKEAIIEGKNIYGKTGTAEVKADQKDKSGTEIGWFDSFDDNGNLLICMCENVKEQGGSHIVVQKAHNIFAKLQ